MIRKRACLALVAGLALVFVPRAVGASEGTVQALVNDVRAAHGLGPPGGNGELAAIAQAQSARMAEAGRIFHNTSLPGEVSDRGVRWTVVGENVGVGPSVEAVHQAFMRSPAHYRNIVDGRYNALGVGVAPGRDGRVYVTQVFGAVESAPATAPRCSDAGWVGSAPSAAESLASASENSPAC